MQVEDVAQIKVKVQRQIYSPGGTGTLLRLPRSYLYSAKLLYMSKSRQLRCAKSEFKLLPSSSKSHQSDKPLLKVYQRGQTLDSVWVWVYLYKRGGKKSLFAYSFNECKPNKRLMHGDVV